MAENGGIVDGDAAVGRQYLAFLREYQGVDLGDPAMVLHEGLVQTHDGLSDGGEYLGRHIQVDSEVVSVEKLEAPQDIHLHRPILSSGTASMSIPPSVLNMTTGHRESLDGSTIMPT